MSVCGSVLTEMLGGAFDQAKQYTVLQSGVELTIFGFFGAGERTLLFKHDLN